MSRPLCPECQRLAVIANSHQRGSVRVRSYGCVRCGQYALGKSVSGVDEPRTRTVIGNNMRDSSGRFAAN